jgi:hypothetical protein
MSLPDPNPLMPLRMNRGRIFKCYGAQESFLRNNSASLCSLAGRYDNPIPIRFLAPIDCLKIPALESGPAILSVLRPPPLSRVAVLYCVLATPPVVTNQAVEVRTFILSLLSLSSLRA